MRRFDLGVSSYGKKWKQLEKTFASIIANSVTDFRVFVCHNPSEGDELTKEAICRIADRDSRFVPIWMPTNVGYAGAVNEILRRSETETVGYCDNDIIIHTPGWDEAMCRIFDMHHEVGLLFPNGGAYPIERGSYTEVMWSPGFCWMTNRLCYSEVGGMDETLGHQEEADWALKVRMGGWKCAALPSIRVHHEATSTNDPASTERINRGVRNWVNAWCARLCGKNINYHSTNVLRWHDWHANALYLEEYFALNGLAGLNANPEVIEIRGEKFDLIKVPRLSGFYRSRII